MKNQYFGDLNDYLKYGLLRAIQQSSGFNIGVCWCLTPNDGGGDGERRRFLQGALDKAPDPVLFSFLRDAATGERHIRLPRERGLIPGACYFEDTLEDKVASRAAYFEAAKSALAGCDLIFMDPDNGIEVQSVRHGRRRCSKYVFWRELSRLYHDQCSLLIYQQFPRISREHFVRRLFEQVKAQLPGSQPAAIATPHVLFVFAMAPAHVARLLEASSAAVDIWRAHFKLKLNR